MHQLDFAEETRLTIVMQECITSFCIKTGHSQQISREFTRQKARKTVFSSTSSVIALKWESRRVFYDTLQLPSLLQTSLPKFTASPREGRMNYEGKRWKESEPIS